jgi:transposase
MSTSNTSKHPSQRRYPPELRERAVRMVREAIAEGGESFGVVTRVARQLGIGVESLRNWVKQAEIDRGQRPGVTTEERRRIAELCRRPSTSAAGGSRRRPRSPDVTLPPSVLHLT